MIDAIGAGERLIGVAFRLLLAGHRVQLVTLTQQGHPIEVVAPEVLLGYTTANRSDEFSKSIKGFQRRDQVPGSGFAFTLINVALRNSFIEVANRLIVETIKST